MSKANNDDRQGEEGIQGADEPARREALRKIGKYGAYVAPAVLALIVGNKAEAACSCA